MVTDQTSSEEIKETAGQSIEENVISSKELTEDTTMTYNMVDTDVNPSSSKMISSEVEHTIVNLESSSFKDIIEKNVTSSNKVSKDTTMTNNMIDTDVNSSSSKMISSEVEGTIVNIESSFSKEIIEKI